MSLDYKIALLYDVPNMFLVDCDDVLNETRKYGKVVIQEAFMKNQANEGLIEVYKRNGYKPIMETIKDIDTSLTARAIELICSETYKKIDLIAIASGDADFIPVVNKAKKYNKEVLILAKKDTRKINGISGNLSKELGYAANYVKLIDVKRVDEAKWYQNNNGVRDLVVNDYGRERIVRVFGFNKIPFRAEILC